MNTNFQFGASPKFLTGPAAAPSRGPAAAPVHNEAPAQPPSDGFTSATPAADFDRFDVLSGTSMASPSYSAATAIAGMIFGKPAEETKPGKLSPQDQEIADDIKTYAADMEISLKDSMNLHFFGDSSAFEIGMSKEQVAASRAETVKKNQHIADYLGIGAKEDKPAAEPAFTDLSRSTFDPEMKFSDRHYSPIGTSMAPMGGGATGPLIGDMMMDAYQKSKAPKPEVTTLQGLGEAKTQQNFASKPIALME